MEPWLILGILSYFSYAISTSIDKHLMNYGHKPLTTNMFKMFFDGVVLLIIGLIFFNLYLTPKLFFWSLLLGGIYAATGILYFRSLQLDDINKTMPYYKSSSLLLTFIGAIILFNEAVNLFNYIGIILILIGIYVVLLEKKFKLPRLNKAITLVLILAILSTAYSLLAKKLLFDIEPINLAIMMYFSSAIIMALYLSVSKKQKKSFNIKSSKIMVSAFFGAIGTFFLYTALSIGDASKIYAISGIQLVFIFIIALIFLKEKFYLYRLIGTITIILGTFLISI